MSTKQVIIFGNSAVAIEAYYALTYRSTDQVVAFTVDREFVTDDSLCGLPVIPFDAVCDQYAPERHGILVAIGYVDNNRLRATRYEQAKKLGYRPISFVSPTTNKYGDVEIGENCFIGHNCTISPNVKIGNNVIIGNHCSIGHDVVISDHCYFSNDVAVSGYVNIGSSCYLGTNSTIRNKVSIGARSVIGAGAVVLEDAGEGSVYLGAAATLLPISSDDLALG